jgi:hypothetical protein
MLLWQARHQHHPCISMLVADMLDRGKPAGTNVSWIDEFELTSSNFTDLDNGQDYKIKSAKVSRDWSEWYTSNNY